MDTRIRLGLVHKLQVPAGLEERLGALAKPTQSSQSSHDTLLNLGCALTNDGMMHKVVLYYRDFRACNGIQDWGVITRRVLESGQCMIDSVKCTIHNPCCFEPTESFCAW